MSKIIDMLFFSLLFSLLIGCSSPSSSDSSNVVLLKTTLGDVKVLLYDETPIHRDNFKALVNAGVYDDVLFHRVIKDFMIQGGDPSTKSSGLPAEMDSLKTYTIPAEFNNKYFHKKGALAAARQGNNINPYMRSSGTQFYIVQGTKFTDEQLDQYEEMIGSSIVKAIFNRYIQETIDSAKSNNLTLSDGEIQDKASDKMFKYLTANDGYTITPEMRDAYKTVGGYPSLDGTYTVFGEVIEGLDIVDKIAASKTSNDKPISDVRIIKAKIVSK